MGELEDTVFQKEVEEEVESSRLQTVLRIRRQKLVTEVTLNSECLSPTQQENFAPGSASHLANNKLCPQTLSLKLVIKDSGRAWGHGTLKVSVCVCVWMCCSCNLQCILLPNNHHYRLFVFAAKELMCCKHIKVCINHTYLR